MIAPMPKCLNCGAFVTETYVRVREPEGFQDARCCPECPDKIRDGGDVRDARSPRKKGQRDGVKSEIGGESSSERRVKAWG